jgi:hypothetical protein
MRELPARVKNILEFGGFCLDTKLLRFPEMSLALSAALRFDDRAGQNRVNHQTGCRYVNVQRSGRGG